MRKTLAAATMAASLTIGGAAGVALFAPQISGAQTDETTESAQTDATRHEPGTRIAEVLVPLVENGTITQDQSDAVVAALVEAAPDRPRHRGHVGARIARNVLPDVLGLEAEELRELLVGGATVGEIADQQGVDRQAVVDALVAPIAEHLDQAVENGRLTEDEAAEKLAEATQRAEESLDRAFDGERGPHGPEGFGPGGPGPEGTDTFDS